LAPPTEFGDGRKTCTFHVRDAAMARTCVERARREQEARWLNDRRAARRLELSGTPDRRQRVDRDGRSVAGGAGPRVVEWALRFGP
jgi:hypothetical protein